MSGLMGAENPHRDLPKGRASEGGIRHTLWDRGFYFLCKKKKKSCQQVGVFLGNMCDALDPNLEQAPAVFPGEGGFVQVQSHLQLMCPSLQAPERMAEETTELGLP